MYRTLDHYHRVKQLWSFLHSPREFRQFSEMASAPAQHHVSSLTLPFGEKGLPVTVLSLSPYHRSLQNSLFRSQGVIPEFYASHALATLEFVLKQD